MRYEDASQAGSVSNDVNARDDADHLAASDFGPATGNAITGTGTITGATGTDSGGQIVAITGAGGSDDSIADGQLEVAGQYGTLTIDAEGNYSYVRNPGTPDGVSDTFTYTLAGEAGATDTANLVINIGDIPMLQAEGTQTIQTNNGVIVLPAGVELSDVRVVGRDLVITLPDGSTMVIPDGAVFVPQLVLDGVEVPAANLAALLIDAEPKPAAGGLTPAQQSGGGNFEVPVQPLDPGVPLGDLLPPTELDYTPPEFEDPGIEIDDNDPPLIGVSSVNVSEEGVSAIALPNPDNTGSPDTTNSPTNGGVLPVSDPDGDSLTVTLGTPSESLTSQGVAITWSVSPDGHTLTGSAGGNTVITVVINDAGVYTVTLLRPVDHPNGGGEQGTSFVIPASVSDGEDVTTGGAITVTIEDDSPTIVGQVAEPILTVDDTTFNINDVESIGGAIAVSYGADGPAAANPLTYEMGINAGATGLFDTLSGEQVVLTLVGGVVIGTAGAGGPEVFRVSVDALGNVTLDQSRAVVHNDPNDPAETGDSTATLAADNLVTVSIVATDRDGDEASITVNIGQNLRFEDDGPSIDPVLNANATVLLDETGPAAAAAINTGAIVKGDDPHVAGTGAISAANSGGAIVNANAVFGNDGPAAGGGISYALVLGASDTPLTLTDGSTITTTLVGGVIVGVVDNGPFAGQAAFAISINPTTGVVSVEQYLSLDHPVNPNPNDPLGMGENTVGVTVTATDGDGDPVTSGAIDISGQITFLDDGPAVDPVLNANATVLLDETGPAVAATLNTGAIVKGDDPHVGGTGAISKATSGGAIVAANAVFGADGPAAGGGISYALVLGASDTPLTLTDGSTITTTLVGDVIVGVVDNGPFAGQAAFAIAIDANTGVVTVEQYLSLDHPVNPNPNDPLGLGANTVGVTVTATDGDGDPVTSGAIDISGQITFLDDGPAVDPVLNANATVLLDETGPAVAATINTGGITKGDDPHVAGTNAISAANSGGAIVNANAVFGADGPMAGSPSYALVLGASDTPLTLTDGSTITTSLVGGVIVGVVDNGPFAGQAAFAIAIDPVTGVVSVEQYLSLDHPVNPNPNDPLGLGANTVGVTVTATDGDGDPVTSGAIDISGQITFLDDGPSIDPVLDREATITVDESLPSTVPTINTGAILKGDDPDLAGGLALGFGTSGTAVVDANAVFGADGPAAGGGISYQLALGANDTSLTLTDGSTITTQLVGGVIVGVVDNGPFAGQAAFAIAIDANTGVVTVEQYLSLDHPVNPDPNDPLGLGEDTVSVTVTATDGDGDPVTSDAIDISNQITFLDDGPSVDPALNANATVLLDETGPAVAATINTGAIIKGDDPHVAGTNAISKATSGGAIVAANAVFGADGPAAGGGISYALVLGASDTPLTLTDGSTITTSLVGGVIVGVVDNGPFAGQAAFAIAIDANTGVVTVEQYLSLDHPVNPNPNDPLGLGANTVGVTVTATDGDGDPVTSGAIDISGQITFLDDGPAVDPVLNANATVLLDETGPAVAATLNTGAIVKGDDPHVGGTNAISKATSGGAIVAANAVFGADGPAAGGGISYALVLGASDTPLTLTDGSTITTSLVGGVIVGVVDNGPFAGQAAFAIAIDPTTGVVTVEQYLSLDHPVNPNPNDPLGLGANTVGVTVTATDGDGDPVTSGAIDISGQITFLDDGPSVNPTLSTQGPAIVDESAPVAVAAIDTLAIVKGNDPDLAGGLAIGSGSTAGPVINAGAVFGADGPAAAGSLTYALEVIDPVSGLTTTEGHPINLVELANGVVVGVVSGGPFNGQAAFAFSINSTTGVVTVEQYLSLDHPLNPNPNDAIALAAGSLGATVTATDGDGDPVTSAAVDISSQISFLDDGPDAVDDVVNQLGENQPVTFGVFGNDTFGADGVDTDNVPDVHVTFTQPPPGEGTVSYNGATGQFTFTPAPGQVGQTSFTYTIIDNDGDPDTATVTINLAADSVPDVVHVTAAVDDDGLVGPPAGNPASTLGDIDANDDETIPPGNPSEAVFVGEINVNFGGDTGFVDFSNLHMTGGTVGTETVEYTWNGATDTLTATVDGGPRDGLPLFTVHLTPSGEYTVTLLDNVIHAAGGNEASAPAVVLNFHAEDTEGDFNNDGTLTITFNDDMPSVVPSLNANATVTLDETGPAVAATINTGAVTKGDDPHVAGTNAISKATSGGAIVAANAVFGADGPAAGGGLSYALVLGASDTPLTLTDGSTITTTLVGNVIVGVVDNGPFAGQAAFAIAIDANTGVVTVEQYLSLDHPVNPNPNDPLGMGPNTIGVTVTATDGDGDPVTSNAVDISGQITFLDDGPSVNPVASTQGPALVDESAPVAAAAIDTLAITKGDDPHLSGGLAIGSGSTAGSVISAGALFGADGPAAAGSLTYGLEVINAASGLTTTEGNAINLVELANGVVVGVVSGGPFNGQAAFAVQIDSATGVITVEQYLSLDHPLNPNPNDAISMLAGRLGATVTATDGDGDSVTSAPVDISNQISFLDDGPTLGVIEDGTANNNPAAAHSFGSLNFVAGADGPGTVMTITANVAGLTSGGIPLETSQTGNVLTAYTDANNNDIVDAGEAVFTLTVNTTGGPSNGTWDFDLIKPIDGTPVNTPIGGSSSFGAGPTGYQILQGADLADLAVVSGYLVDTVNGGDGDGTFDAATWLSTGVLVPAEIASAGVNGSTAGWGVDNNGFENANELFFFDFGSQATSDPDAGGAFVPPVQGPDVPGDPPEVQMPDISFATFEFINYKSGAGNLGDDIAYVVHYTDGTFTSGFIPAANIDGALWTHTAPAGKFIADIQFFSGLEPDGTSQDLPPGKIDLVSVGVQSTTLDKDISFSVTLQDGDGDPTAVGNFTINIADGNTPSTASPVVLDTNGDGVVSFLAADAGVAYDYNGDGTAETTAWVAPGDSILVRDANGNGLVDDASEFVFGGGNGMTDLEALHAQYGEQLDASDADFTMFAVWNDANSNGAVDANELQSLAEAGIVSLNLVSDGIAYSAAGGDVQVAGTATYTNADGSTGTMADASFAIGGAKSSQEVERVAANSNSVTLAAAVAAAGLAASSAAAATPAIGESTDQLVSNATVGKFALVGLDGGDSPGGAMPVLNGLRDGGLDFGMEAMASTSFQAIAAGNIGELAVDVSIGSGPTALLEATDYSAMLQIPMPSTGLQVAMPSIDSLAASAGVDAQTTGAVEQILADALQGGGSAPDIDALLNALPGAGLGDGAGLNGLATPVGDTVPAWDTGQGGVFTFDAATIITSEAMVLHHDAVQPVANG